MKDENIDWQSWLINFMKYTLFALTIFSLGVFAGYKYFVPELQAKLKRTQEQLKFMQHDLLAERNKPSQINTETKTKTEIAYVPKETIIFRDAQTGETITGLESTDVQLNVKPPAINMKYNGKNYEMPGISGETAKFEKGKLVGEVATKATIDVTDLVNKEVNYFREKEQKNFTLGGYLTNEGFVGSIGVVRGNLEYKIIGKVPKIKEFYGAGMEFKF